ncbi:hypothetical protein [Trinickia sp. EG282A]|uniref:hypothetical protein n=1 Tax=Trinickia sp. EG282A TaxID=3237013 RepID=UPI0034D2E512
MKKAPLNYGHLVLTLGLLTLATTAYSVWRHYSPLPFNDQWDGAIGAYLQASQNPWHALFAQHNEHRLAVPRLLFFADLRYFGGRNVMLLTVNLVLAGLLALTFVRIAVGQDRKIERRAQLSIAGAALIFGYSWIQQENFTWGFQGQWFAVYLFALTAFYSLELASRARAKGQARESFWWLIAALLSATVSAYSMSSGVLVFPVLLVQAMYSRFRPAALGFIFLVGVLVWVAYFNDWHSPTSNGTVMAAWLQHPLDAFRYVLLYLGAPARSARLGAISAHLGVASAYTIGALVLVSLAVFVVKAATSDSFEVRATSLLAFSLFIVGNAAITAGGRLWLGLEFALSSRYTTAALAVWTALIAFAAVNARSAKEYRWISAIGGIAVVLVLSAQRSALDSPRDEVYPRLVAGLALRAHVYDPEITRAVYPFPDQLIAKASAAEKAGLSIFAPASPDYLVPPAQVRAASSCEGAVDAVSPTTTPGVYRASGWIYDENDKRVPRHVIVTDIDGATIGSGVTGGTSSEGKDAVGRRATYSGWTAFFRARAEGDIQVAARAPGGTFCKIKSAVSASARPATSAH